MINDFGVGGLKIPSIIIVPSINPSKLNWIEKYLDNNNKGKWKIFLNPKKYGCQNFFSHNLNVRDTLSIIGSLSNDNGDGNENVTNLHI